VSEHGTLFYNSASPNCSHGYSFEVGSSLEETNNPLGADSAKALLMFLFDFILLFQTSVALSYHRANNLTRERECPLFMFLVPIRPGLAP